MQTFKVLHFLILISLTTTLIEAQNYSDSGCIDTCGDVLIPFPFGIGRDCSLNKWYNVDCNSSIPYLSALNNVELLGVYLNTVTVNFSVLSVDCKNPVQNSDHVLSNSPFWFSGSRNRLVVKGCGNAVIMNNGTVVTGCSSTCGGDVIVSDINSCFGSDCCQTTIPRDLKSLTLNLRGLQSPNDSDGTCVSAFLVDTNYTTGRFLSESIVEDHTFVPLSLSWDDVDDGSARCNSICGDVLISYPFGIGASCSLNEWYNVDCNSSIPYLSAFNNVQILDLKNSPQTVIANLSVISNCENPVKDINLPLYPSHAQSPFVISGEDNILVFEGCGHAAIVEKGTIVAGCSTSCGNYTLIDRSDCFGIGCCQAAIPPDLESFTFNLTGLERQSRDGNCGSAFLIDRDSFNQGRFSRQFAPITLWWTQRPDVSTECRNCQLQGGICSNNTNGITGFSCLFYESRKKDRKKPLDVILGVSISMGFLVLTVISYGLYKLIKKTKAKRRKQKCFKRNGGLLLKQQEATDVGLVDKTKLFTAKELAKATDQFNENRILGRGGQGTVYKGMLGDGRIVAIKKSKVVDESQLKEFINEVVILSQVNHRNVVKLLGCCLETEVPLLVSEFISNGTLYDFIQDEIGEFSISLNMRLQIATEVARALSYLHSATSIPIYHRDIKTTNILLDEKYRAKVSDFGTSRFVSIDQTHLTTLVKGTFGYLDPEYFQSSQFTEKSDVYSFGVVLLELLTREKPISFTRFGENRSLVTHFVLAMEEGRVMSIFDTMIVNEDSRIELLALANLAIRCLNLNGKHRPTMKEVAMELEGIRVSHVPCTIQTNFGIQKHFEDLPLTYSE